MVTKTFASTTRIEAPVDVVWSVMTDHVRWARWGTSKKVTMAREGTPAPNGLGAIRCFHAGPVKVLEEVTLWDAPTHMRYRLNSKQFTRHYESDMRLRAEGDATVLEWTSSFSPLVPGTAGLVRRILESAVKGFAAGIAREAEAEAEAAAGAA